MVNRILDGDTSALAESKQMNPVHSPFAVPDKMLDYCGKQNHGRGGIRPFDQLPKTVERRVPLISLLV